MDLAGPKGRVDGGREVGSKRWHLYLESSCPPLSPGHSAWWVVCWDRVDLLEPWAAIGWQGAAHRTVALRVRSLDSQESGVHHVNTDNSDSFSVNFTWGRAREVVTFDRSQTYASENEFV